MALHTNRTVGLATLGSPSPRPSPLGRGRTVHGLSITAVAEFAQQLLAEHSSEARCSLSLRERVRVRGKYSVADRECSISQRLLITRCAAHRRGSSAPRARPAENRQSPRSTPRL